MDVPPPGRFYRLADRSFLLRRWLPSVFLVGGACTPAQRIVSHRGNTGYYEGYND